MNHISSNKFIEKATATHKNKYDYSNVTYIGCNVPVEIICKTHGPFFQKPKYHILRNSGCPSCYRDSQKYTEYQFLSQARKKYGDKFIYGQYCGFRNPITITCPIHGQFSLSPLSHLKSQHGCIKCRHESLCLTKEAWINKFTNTHGHLYDYTDSVITTGDRKFNVRCISHGIFTPTPANHARGHGCPTCACVDKYVGGYSEEFFQLHPEKKHTSGYFYIISVDDEQEQFIKIGITNRTVAKRFKSVLPYEYECIAEIKMSLYDAHLLEEQILQQHKSNRHIPSRRFPGWTECFNATCKQDLLKNLSDFTGD